MGVCQRKHHHLLGQRSKSQAPPQAVWGCRVSRWLCQHLWGPQLQEVMGPQLAKVELCWGRQGKLGDGYARKERKVLERSVGRSLASAAEWAVANLPYQHGQPRALPQPYSTLVSAEKGCMGRQENTVVLASLPLVNWVLRLTVSIFWLGNLFWMIWFMLVLAGDPCMVRVFGKGRVKPSTCVDWSAVCGSGW